MMGHPVYRKCDHIYKENQKVKCLKIMFCWILFSNLTVSLYVRNYYNLGHRVYFQVRINCPNLILTSTQKLNVKIKSQRNRWRETLFKNRIQQVSAVGRRQMELLAFSCPATEPAHALIPFIPPFDHDGSLRHSKTSGHYSSG